MVFAPEDFRLASHFPKTGVGRSRLRINLFACGLVDVTTKSIQTGIYVLSNRTSHLSGNCSGGSKQEQPLHPCEKLWTKFFRLTTEYVGSAGGRATNSVIQPLTYR